MPPASSNQGFESSVTVQLGLCWDSKTQNPAWMKGKIFQTPEVLIKLTLEPSLFLNEAYLTVSLKVSKTFLESPDWLQESSLQVIPQNVRLSVPGSSKPDTCFGPYGVQDQWDGPLCNFDEILMSEKTLTDFQVMSRFHLSSLQRVPDPALKFRMFLLYQGCPIQCKGIINFHVPICQNMPNLKIANIVS
jgi:hypothetical protein